LPSGVHDTVSGLEIERFDHRQHEQAARNSTPSINRPIKAHKRSQTLGDAGTTTQSGRISKPGQLSFAKSSLLQFPQRTSVLSEEVLNKARRLVPAGRLDTTRTDYFRLKALGIDPDTSLNSSARKRRISDDRASESNKSSRLSSSLNGLAASAATSTNQPLSGATSGASAYPADDNDDDEALFAQMRQVRAAMSDSISWFREEREKSELSRSRSASATRDAVHPEPDRPAPSRTTARLEATGAHGFWKRAGDGVVGTKRSWGAGQEHPHGQTQGEEDAADERAARPMGLQALGHGGRRWPGGGADGAGDWGGRGAAASTGGSGASVDDAIEL
jgi:hypothetical protein